jgi:putative chitinase
MAINRQRFFSGYRQGFGPLSQSQVDGLLFLLSSFEASGQWGDLRHVSYALASTKHETADTYQPIVERGSNLYLSKYYWSRKLRWALGNVKLTDAWNFKGRGYVQITGRRNYTLFGALLSQPLITAPDLALDPDIAFEIMSQGMHYGHFTGARLGHYITGKKCDYFNARRVINGTDRAELLAGYAQRFERVLTEASR